MWITELKKYVETDIPIIIAANKSDLKNRVINQSNAEKYAQEEGVKHFNTSAKTGLNVKEIFR